MVRGLYLIKAQFLSAKRYKIDFYGSFFVPLLTIIPLLFLYYLGSKSNIVKFFYGHRIQRISSVTCAWCCLLELR